MKVNLLPRKTITQSELNRIAQQLQDLRDALQPFADYAKGLPPIIPGVHRDTDDKGTHVNSFTGGKNYNVTFGDFRRARALLDKLLEEDEARLILQTENDMAGKECAYHGCGKHFVNTQPAADGSDLFCSSLCMARDAFWKKNAAEEYSCCGGGAYAEVNGTPHILHCTDCDHYKEPP